MQLILSLSDKHVFFAETGGFLRWRIAPIQRHGWTLASITIDRLFQSTYIFSCFFHFLRPIYRVRDLIFDWRYTVFIGVAAQVISFQSTTRQWEKVEKMQQRTTKRSCSSLVTPFMGPNSTEKSIHPEVASIRRNKRSTTTSAIVNINVVERELFDLELEKQNLRVQYLSCLLYTSRCV